MYKEHFDIKASPFSMTPDPSVLYITPSHREALAGLAYAIFEKKGFAVLVGEAGTGKSTLLARTLLHVLTSRVISSVILNPTLNESEFLELVLLDFGFPEVPASKAQRLMLFQEFLIRTHKAGKIAVLVIDEAHKMTLAVLEEVRLLSNLEFPGEKLLQIVLAGQPELMALLSRPDLFQLSQRISVRLNIERLTAPDIEHYVVFRWKLHASSAPPFTAEAYRSIARFSQGIPRLVNAICDTSLMLAFADKSRTVESTHIEAACRDLWLSERPHEPRRGAIGADTVKIHANGTSPRRAGVTDVSVANLSVPVPDAQLRVLESYGERRSFWSWVTRSRPAGQREK